MLKRLEDELEQTEYHLANIVEYAISYFTKLLEKYGKGRERKTEIKSFDTINTTIVAANNQKLYVNRADGFVGYGLKKDEFVCECSDIDDIMAIRKDGKFMVSRISEKTFMGKDILYAGVWKKGDERMTFNLAYVDAKSGRSMVKRFNVTAITRDKEYDLTKGAKGSRVLYLSANPNGEAEVVTVKLTSASKARLKVFDFDFATLDIKGRGAGGNILTKYPVRKVEFKAAGLSTLSGLDIWYDKSVGRLNKDERGDHIGNFNGDDKILVIYKDGSYELTSYELTNRYEPAKISHIERLDANKPISVIHYDGESKNYYVKRFKIETTTTDKRFVFISESPGSKLVVASTYDNTVVEVEYIKAKGKDKEVTQVALEELIDVKGWKAIGNKLSPYIVKKVKFVSGKNDVKEQQEITESDSVTSSESVANDESPTSENKDSTPSANENPKSDPGNSKPNGYGAGDTIELDF